MADPTTMSTREEQERMHHASAARYWIVWIALCTLTGLTFLFARTMHLPSPSHVIVALAIASAKSALVVLFFMHLWDHGGANRIVFVTPVFFVLLLIGLVVLDNATRFPLTNPGRGETLQHEPPGPDILSPNVYPPQPTRREDMPSAVEPGRDVSIPALPK